MKEEEKKVSSKKLTMISAAFMMTLLIISTVSAFGVAREYWEGKPLRLHPGQETIIELNLQNTELNGDITIEAFFTNNASGMASFVKEENTYLIKEGTHDTYLPIRFNVPEDAEIGTTTKVSIRLREAKGEEGAGLLTIGTSTETGFPIEITKKEESTNYQPEETNKKKDKGNKLWYIIILLLIILIIIRHKKKTTTTKTRTTKKKSTKTKTTKTRKKKR